MIRCSRGRTALERRKFLKVYDSGANEIRRAGRAASDSPQSFVDLHLLTMVSLDLPDYPPSTPCLGSSSGSSMTRGR
jgi:hypothetical protein